MMKRIIVGVFLTFVALLVVAVEANAQFYQPPGPGPNMGPGYPVGPPPGYQVGGPGRPPLVDNLPDNFQEFAQWRKNGGKKPNTANQYPPVVPGAPYGPVAGGVPYGVHPLDLAYFGGVGPLGGLGNNVYVDPGVTSPIYLPGTIAGVPGVTIVPPQVPQQGPYYYSSVQTPVNEMQRLLPGKRFGEVSGSALGGLLTSPKVTLDWMAGVLLMLSSVLCAWILVTQNPEKAFQKQFALT